ncbi:uncharacterized protein METZ01_LOCUS22189 [marine metagenome]|uniref:Uncharacterized protein n=1 Tax=marine metagenome TaxID=408172 RepID=A0A381PQK9_9ZZZZ
MGRVHCGPQQAPLAQLDRASGYGPGGWGFDSLGARHTITKSEDPGTLAAEKTTAVTSGVSTLL